MIASTLSNGPLSVNELKAQSLDAVFGQVAIANRSKALKISVRARDPHEVELLRGRPYYDPQPRAADVFSLCIFYEDGLAGFTEILDSERLKAV